MFKRMKNAWVRLVVRRATVEASIHSLGFESDELHREAMVEPDRARSKHLRDQADFYAQEQTYLRDALYRQDEVAAEALEAGFIDQDIKK